jgi:hypothetical protein
LVPQARTTRRWPRFALAGGAALLAGSLAWLIPAWAASRATVHTVSSARSASLALRAGPYQVYQDPGVLSLGNSPGEIRVTGPAGRIRVHALMWNVKPSDAAAPVLGIGLFVSVAGFTIPRAGTYRVAISRAAGGEKVFVGEPLSTALRATGPPAAGVAAGVILMAAGWRWPRRRGRLMYQWPAAPPASA